MPGMGIDPFDTSATKFDEQTRLLLQHYIKVICPSRFHAETRSRSAQKHLFHLAENEVIRGCLENELHMIKLLTSTASRMQYMEKTYLAGSPVASTQLVFDIFHLFTAKAYRFNNAGAKVHLKAAKAIIEQMGGQSALEGTNLHLVETLVVGDLFVAAEDLSPLVFEFTFDPGFGSAKYLSLPTGTFQTQMGIRLLNPAQDSIVGPQTYQVGVKVVIRTSALLEPLSEALRWLYLRNLSIRHHLVRTSPGNPRTRALHTALQIWILMAFTGMGPVRTTKVMAPKLQDMLSRIGLQGWVGHEDVYAWILSVGAIAARETLLEDWFVHQIVLLPVCEELGSIEQLRQFSEQIFYLDSIQSKWLERVTQQLSLARNSRTQIVATI